MDHMRSKLNASSAKSAVQKSNVKKDKARVIGCDDEMPDTEFDIALQNPSSKLEALAAAARKATKENRTRKFPA